MADPTILRQYPDLTGSIARHLGYGLPGTGTFDIDSLTDAQASVVTDCLWSGLNRFLKPPPLPGEGTVHVWSFLKIIKTMTLTPGTGAYVMPDNFGGVNERVHCYSHQRPVPIQFIGSEQMNELRQRNGLPQGFPRYYNLEAYAPEANKGTRYYMGFFPVPDLAYQLHFHYIVQPDKLTEAAGYPYMMAVHSETLLLACLDVANERYLDNMDDRAKDRMKAAYMEQLVSSIQTDRNGTTQETVGRMGDLASARYREVQMPNPRFTGIEWDT